MNMRAGIVLGAMGVLAAAGSATAQTLMVGPRAGQYPDVIVSSVGPRLGSTMDLYGTVNGISSYAIGSDSCNIGSAAAIWVDGLSTSPSLQPYLNQHPVIGGQIYRLFNNRFEQIGMGWLKHGYCAADDCSGTPAGCTDISPSPTGNCSTTLGGSGCNWLSYGRGTDTYSAYLNGRQGDLGPRSEVNPWTGVYPYPWIRQGNNPTPCLNKRLLVRKSELDPASYPSYNATTNPTGARFYGEVVYIATDEWPNERLNNYSYRPISRGALSSPSSTNVSCGGSDLSYSLTFNGSTIPLKVALEAWKAADPTVRLVYADAPNDGRFALACKVVDRGDGTYQYEYAVMNMNSDRGAGAFIVPKSSSLSLTITDAAFRGVEYHSGEPYSATPWTIAVEGAQVSFSTETYAANANANALRWSTLYNFRFVANTPPEDGSIVLGLFKPAVVTGVDPDSLSISGLLVPSAPSCPADFNHAGGVTVQDIFDFLGAWFSSSLSADFNGIGGLTVQDIFDFLGAWFSGCP